MLSIYFPLTSSSNHVQRPQPLPGLSRPAPGRRGAEGHGDRRPVRQRDGEQRERRPEPGGEAARPPHHHQGQTAGDAEGGVRRHPQTHPTHQGAAGPGDRPQHEGDPGERAPDRDYPPNLAIRSSIRPQRVYSPSNKPAFQASSPSPHSYSGS